MINQVTLIGRLASFVNIVKSNINKDYIFFTLAVDSKNGKTDFFTVFSFNERLLKLADLTTKGSPIALECRLHSFLKNNKRELSLILEDFKLLETKSQFEERKAKNFAELDLNKLKPSFEENKKNSLVQNNFENNFQDWDLDLDNLVIQTEEVKKEEQSQVNEEQFRRIFDEWTKSQQQKDSQQ
ncbi:single-stranded DNA-binding protein [Mesomycoplasma hyopneumoniae]|uniref:single-stranded DNA-binding protein n=1 Tax=Mesomycoplasma hyopneumoniae TaxID=2099 RepID=UPI00136A7692|nr:single-stranded DNA-binding protein [Mesomycoplasma hyopneumoniae]MXR09988.1 single-stranded DNA-binding protein [Mesomycoplasma hyopneumoniae]